MNLRSQTALSLILLSSLISNPMAYGQSSAEAEFAAEGDEGNEEKLNKNTTNAQSKARAAAQHAQRAQKQHQHSQQHAHAKKSDAVKPATARDVRDAHRNAGELSLEANAATVVANNAAHAGAPDAAALHNTAMLAHKNAAAAHQTTIDTAARVPAAARTPRVNGRAEHATRQVIVHNAAAAVHEAHH